VRANRVCRGAHSFLRQVPLQLVVAQPFPKLPPSTGFPLALKTRSSRPLPPDSSDLPQLIFCCPTSVQRSFTRYQSFTSTEASHFDQFIADLSCSSPQTSTTSTLSFPQLRGAKTFHSQNDSLLQPAGAGPQVLLTQIWLLHHGLDSIRSEWIPRSCLTISYLLFHYC
jgi:hypothetical protein